MTTGGFVEEVFIIEYRKRDVKDQNYNFDVVYFIASEISFLVKVLK